jgi:hypothetical protein
MTKNPLLEKKFQEGYNQGFKLGKDVGIATAVDFIATKLEALHQMPGVGTKTIEKLKKALGEEYFKEIDK